MSANSILVNAIAEARPPEAEPTLTPREIAAVLEDYQRVMCCDPTLFDLAFDDFLGGLFTIGVDG